MDRWAVKVHAEFAAEVIGHLRDINEIVKRLNGDAE